MRWCRLYAEFATDPKVQQMSEEMQRRLIILFCLHTNGDLPGASNEELLCAFRIKKSELFKTFQLFLQKNFIDDEWNLINWKKRQFQSDDVAARVRKYRESKKDAECNVTETLLKRKCNVLDTDTDTETDTDKKENKRKKVSPSAPVVDLPGWMDETTWNEFKEHRKSIKATMTPLAQTKTINELFKLMQDGHDPTEVMNQSIANGWKGVFGLNDRKPNRTIPGMKPGMLSEKGQRTALNAKAVLERIENEQRESH